jgi:acetylornithine deacetylase/succinyl-diaminopimelate desuccinylase-like protein
MNTSQTTFNHNPAPLLQKLIQFNTTNPPGNEAECVRYLNDLLTSAGLETTILEKKSGRSNLIARLQGVGTAPPFLLQGHTDVVSAADQSWTHSPFEGLLDGGFIWGRGALDMKGPLAMMISAVLQLKAQGITPPGDIVLAVVADEEDEGEFGARYLVEEHPELFKGIQYAIGEIGGFTLHLNHKKFYPIMIAEKQKCTFRAIIKGPAGHGSMPIRNGATAKLSYLLQKVTTRHLPVHITPPVRLMLQGLTKHLSFPVNLILKQLLTPNLTDLVLDLLGAQGNFFAPLLHHTVAPTIIRGGTKVNVIPAEITVEFDGRLLPGFKPQDLIDELHALVGPDYQFQITCYIPGPPSPNLTLYETLGTILHEMDPEAIPIPLTVSGATDARYFSQLGIQTYGFTPMNLPSELNFSKLLHAADERIPIEALEFGTQAIFKLLQRAPTKGTV